MWRTAACRCALLYALWGLGFLICFVFSPSLCFSFATSRLMWETAACSCVLLPAVMNTHPRLGQAELRLSGVERRTPWLQVLEFLTNVLAKFPAALLDTRFSFFLLPLATRLASEPSAVARGRLAAAVATLLTLSLIHI